MCQRLHVHRTGRTAAGLGECHAGQYIEAMTSHATARPQLPQLCELCRRWGRQALCGDCRAQHTAPRPRCATCGLATGLALARCGACLHAPPPFEHTVCVADYGHPWDRLIAAFKFEGRAELAGLLAEPLADAVARAWAAGGGPPPDLVLPVPLSPERLQERGYNQAWELARRVACRLGLQADATLLQRPITTAHQSALTRAERQRNLRTAFMLAPERRAQVAGRRVALVDDVMTTGATVHEAALVLRRAGAAAVDVWVLARTPEPTAQDG